MKKLALLATLLLAALLPLQAQTVVYSGLRSYAASAIGADTGVRLIGSAISWHILTWTKSGTVTVCSVQVDSSADNITWGDGDIIAVQDCSSNGATIPYNFTVNYVRIHFVTTFTGTGSVTAVWTGYISRPGGAVGPATANQVAYFTGTDTVGGDTGLTYDPATGLTIGGAGLGYMTPAADPTGGDLVAGKFWFNNTAPAAVLSKFYDGTAKQTNLTSPASLFGSSPAALLVTKAAGADPTTDNCVKWLAGGGVGDAGAACGIGIKSIWIDTPVVADSGRIQFMFPVAVTITRVACSTKLATSTVDLNMEERAAATPDTAGTDVLSAELVCDTNQQTSCASGCDVNTITNGGIAARVPVAITPSAIANAPTDLRIFIEYY
jgi:hypothetical protein